MTFDDNLAVDRQPGRADGTGMPKNMTPNWAKVAADLDSSLSAAQSRQGQAQPQPVQPASRVAPAATADNNIGMVLDIPVQLSVELGRTKLPIKQVLELKPGSVVELDSVSGEPIDVLVNGYLIAQGEIVVVNGKFGIRLTDVVTPSERFKRFGRA